MENALHARAQILAGVRRGCISFLGRWDSSGGITRDNNLIPSAKGIDQPPLSPPLFAPIFLFLPLHRRASRVLRLEPIRRAAAAIRRVLCASTRSSQGPSCRRGQTPWARRPRCGHCNNLSQKCWCGLIGYRKVGEMPPKGAVLLGNDRLRKRRAFARNPGPTLRRNAHSEPQNLVLGYRALSVVPGVAVGPREGASGASGQFSATFELYPRATCQRGRLTQNSGCFANTLIIEMAAG